MSNHAPLRSPPRPPRTAVVVLGDLGRSPRMLYHAQAAAAAGAEVELVGLGGSALPAAIRSHAAIRVHRLADDTARSSGGVLLAAARRAAAQARHLAATLRALPGLDTLLVQTPPVIPTVAIARRAARAHGARLVLDWHNLGYRMLALRLGAAHPAVRAAALYERRAGRAADAHLCVSQAMRERLAGWGIEAVTLPDRPAARFVPLADEAREAAARVLCARYGVAGRPAVIVSPTSWTPDEPFELLLAAANAYAARRGREPGLPELLVLVSGRGALRARFEADAAAAALPGVHIHTLWLEPEAYPGLLAAADLGLSLHRSASGVDLPMKIADMFGAGLPVCALEYGPCLRELIKPDDNGVVFADAGELADRLAEVLRGFPDTTARLDRLRRGALAEAAGERWEDAWTARARALILPS